jgi:hypothetical protein
MDEDWRDTLARTTDHLALALEEERFRHVAGIEPAPGLARLFASHDEATHPETVARLREAGEKPLLRMVGALRAERLVAGQEEAWRAAESGAPVMGPDGLLPLAQAEAALAGEPDPVRRRALAAAVAVALGPAASLREQAAEARVRVRAELGLVPDWPGVVAGDQLLDATEDAWSELLTHAARRDLDLAPQPRGDLTRADLLRLLAFPAYDGLFRRSGLSELLRAACGAVGLDAGSLRIGETTRVAAWPGAHAVGERIAFRPRGGLPDWLDLLDAAGRAAIAGRRPPSGRDPTFTAAFGWLLQSLLLEPGFLAARVELTRREQAEVTRALALRALFRLRASSAAARVATEVERGMSGVRWREAHREALTSACHAAWDGVRAVRDDEAGPLLARIAGFAEGERLRVALRERFDEDWWRNPRTPEHLAGLLAAGRFGEASPASTTEASRGVVRSLETGGVRSRHR